jgi:hypothetical protein
LDLFSPEQCRNVIEKIRRSLRPEGCWLACDFVNITWWQGALLSAMYWFFSIVSDLDVNSLPEWRALMAEKGLKEVRAMTFYRKFIRSTLFMMKT